MPTRAPPTCWCARPQTADGRKILDGLVAQLEAGPLLTSCRKRHPAAGHLLVSYVLAGRDPLGRPAAKSGLTTICTGSLADTPLGRCVADEIARALATAAVPGDVLGYTKNRRYDFDPEQRPGRDSGPLIPTSVRPPPAPARSDPAPCS